MSHPRIWAVVPAAGIGQRMNGKVPKQYLLLNGRPILAQTLDVICRVPNITQVIVPLHPDDHYWPQLNITYPHLQTIIGGELRFESVLNALEVLKETALPDDWVLVHDAVRPCVTEKGIASLLTEIMSHPIGGLWGVPLRDTLKQLNQDHEVQRTIPRDHLWHALTPQIFRFKLLYEALLYAQQEKIPITDEAAAIEHMGYHPKMVLGSYANIKITYPEDLEQAQLWIQQKEKKCE